MINLFFSPIKFFHISISVEIFLNFTLNSVIFFFFIGEFLKIKIDDVSMMKLEIAA